MKKVILFSTLTEVNTNKITSLLFPEAMKDKSLAFMPSDGIINCKQEYIDQWQSIAHRFNAGFAVIDNLSENTDEEILKLQSSNILVISGGNTFKLLGNLRTSGLDKAVLEFTRKDTFVLSGYSAGALVLTPSIEVCNLPKYDSDAAGITDLTGLQIVDFEIFPHYAPEDEKVFQEYSKKTNLPVKAIADDGFVELSIS